MILTCPSCSTRYVVNPASLGSDGKMVRCARCAHSWMQRPPVEPPPIPPEDLEPPPQIIRPLPPGSNLPVARPARGRERSSRAALWVALALAVAGLGLGGALWRDDVVEAWPAS